MTRSSALVLVTLAAVLAALTVPAGASATVFRIGKAYRATVSGKISITWRETSGNEQQKQCTNWLEESGRVEDTLTNGKSFDVTEIPSAGLVGTVVGPFAPTVKYAQRQDSITAENCPGTCPPATAASRLLPPRAHAADCVVPDKVQNFSRTCPALGNWSLSLTGTSRISAAVKELAYVKNDRCRTQPKAANDAPFTVFLLNRSDLRHLGPRGKLIAQNKTTARCPGVKSFIIVTRVKCTYTLRVKLTLRRTR